MADPLTIGAAASLGSSAIGGILSAFGGNATAEANANAAQYQSAIAMVNAGIARQNANLALRRGQIAVENIGMKGAAQQGSIATIQGASGIDIGSGSFKAVQEGARELNRLSELNAIDEARQTAYNFRLQAYSDTLTGKAKQLEVENIRDSAGLNFVSSLLGGASAFASKWSQFKYEGVF